MFFHVNWAESVADRNASLGRPDSFMRSLIQNETGLNLVQAAALKSVAADWKAKMDPIQNSMRSMMAEGATAKTSPALKALLGERDLMVADHIDQVRAALGAGRFATLRSYVSIRHSGTVTLTIPSKKPPADLRRTR